MIYEPEARKLTVLFPKIHELLQFKRIFLTHFEVKISSNYLQLHNLTKWGHMHHVSADWNGEFQF